MDPESPEIGEQPFYEVQVVERLLVIERTSRRYESLSQVPGSFDALQTEIDRAGPFDVAILDLRQAHGRNDSEFEAQLAPERRKLLDRLPRVCFVVQTNIGRMQIVRYLQRDGVKASVFTSLEEAVTEAQRMQRETDIGY
ncbi:MAG: hypothetical protein AAFQ82_10085 [Myxococcota bacterium]